MKCHLLVTVASYVVLVSATKVEELKRNCDFLGRNFYDELKCKPELNHHGCDDDCPDSYTCPKYKIDPQHCTFLGVRYNIGEIVQNTSNCNVGCFCEGGNQFQWLQIDCPWRDPDEQPECYTTYELDQCCPNYEKKCPPYDNVPRCELNGKTYKEGERMDTGDTCWKCICRAGFRGIFEEPHCIRTQCDVELYYSEKIANKCSPVYRNYGGKTSRCCPTGFLCPDEIKDIQIVRSETPNEGRDHCRFGYYRLNMNDYFITQIVTYSETKIGTCTCLLPPYVSCLVN